MTLHRSAAAGGCVLALTVALAGPATAAPPQWNVVPTPAFPGTAYVGRVAAVSSRLAWAAGGTEDPVAGFVLRWDGRTWKREPAADWPGMPLGGAVATGPRNLWAMGGTYDGTGATLHWDGAAWRREALPDGIQGSGLAVTRRGDAWAYGRRGHDYTPVVLRHGPAGWAEVAAPLPEGAEPRSLVAGPGRDVWLGGHAKNGPFLLHWDGRAWTDLPVPGQRDGTVNKILPRSRHDLWVFRGDVTFGYEKTIMHWDGRSWSSTVPPEPLGSSAPIAEDGSGGLWASYGVGGRINYVHYSGGAWTIVQGADLGTTANAGTLQRVPGTRTIWSTGSYYEGSGRHPVIERFR